MKSKIKQIRIMKEISQQQLEGITGIKQSEISRIENNKRNPSFKIIKRIADGLGCRILDLLEE